MTTTKTCEHTMSTLVETRGLGGWDVVEVYRCDACGHRTEVRVDTSSNDEDGDDW